MFYIRNIFLLGSTTKKNATLMGILGFPVYSEIFRGGILQEDYRLPFFHVNYRRNSYPCQHHLKTKNLSLGACQCPFKNKGLGQGQKS